MIRPRRAETSADPALITGLLGATALLGALRGWLDALVADGDRCPPGAEPPRGAGFDEVVDAVLGLAALVRAAERQLPGPPRTDRAGDGDGDRSAGCDAGRDAGRAADVRGGEPVVAADAPGGDVAAIASPAARELLR